MTRKIPVKTTAISSIIILTNICYIFIIYVLLFWIKPGNGFLFELKRRVKQIC